MGSIRGCRSGNGGRVRLALREPLCDPISTQTDNHASRRESFVWLPNEKLAQNRTGFSLVADEAKSRRRGTRSRCSSRCSSHSCRCCGHSGRTRSCSDARSESSDSCSTKHWNSSTLSRPWICSTRTGRRQTGGHPRLQSSRAGRPCQSWPRGCLPCRRPGCRSSS